MAPHPLPCELEGCADTIELAFETVAYVEGEVSPAAQAVVDADDRTPEDRETDVRRHPAELLTFMGVQPGWKVADLAAGGGYTTELLARAVGAEGQVYSHNTPLIVEKFAGKSWPARLAREINKDVARVEAEWEAPIPAETKDLDLVSLIFSYHDIIAMGDDPGPVNAAVFAALKSGGVYIIADHSAVPGTGTADTEKYHRIDDAAVVAHVEAAGFKLDARADFLRKPDDPRTTQVWKVKFDTDRFILRFVKP
jgi:predicted methyltransferase